MRTSLILAILMIVTTSSASADISTSAVFGDSMVLQREKPIHIWGWVEPEASVTVALAGNEVTATSDADGRFDVDLPKMEAGGPHELSIKSGGDTVQFSDALIGEVWLCSGQSNMQWAVQQSNDADLEALSADYPQIRLITVPQVGTQEPQKTFKGDWSACTPETV